MICTTSIYKGSTKLQPRRQNPRGVPHLAAMGRTRAKSAKRGMTKWIKWHICPVRSGSEETGAGASTRRNRLKAERVQASSDASHCHDEKGSRKNWCNDSCDAIVLHHTTVYKQHGDPDPIVTSNISPLCTGVQLCVREHYEPYRSSRWCY